MLASTAYENSGEAYTQPVKKHRRSAIALEHPRDVLYNLHEDSINLAW